MTVKELHRESMRFIDLALLARFDNTIDKVKENYLKAFELEKEALKLFIQNSNQEPTRSILIRSAANLAILSGQLREAEKLVFIGLTGDISEELANEFRDMFQDINFHRHLALKGVVLDTKEVQLSLSGNEVGHGLIRGDEFSNRVHTLEKMAYRTADRLRNKSFTENVSKQNIIDFQPYFSTFRAQSFAVTIRFGGTIKQQMIEGTDIQSVIIGDILNNIQLINDEDYLKLNDNITDETYRTNFIALAKQLAPDGDRIKLVGFTAVKNNEPMTVALTKPASKFKTIATKQTAQATITVQEIEIEGFLSFADAKKNKIKLSNDKVNFEIEVPKGLLSDVVKPFFEDYVIITGTKNGEKIILKDIRSKEISTP